MTGNLSITDATVTEDWKPEWIKLKFKDGTRMICPLNRWVALWGYDAGRYYKYPTNLQFECFTLDEGTLFFVRRYLNFA